MAKYTVLRLLPAVALIACMGTAFAEETPTTLHKVTVVPDQDFARHPPLQAPALSPDGKLIAVAVHNTQDDQDKWQLAVMQLPDLKFVSRLDMVDKYLPIDITWVDNKRLVMGTGEETGFSEQPRATGDIIAVDFDGKNKRLLYSDRARSSTAAMTNMLKIPVGFGQISGMPEQANGHFYMTVNPAPLRGGGDAQAHRTLIFDIDARSGNVNQIAEINRDAYDFLIHDGVARYASGSDNQMQDHTFYRASADQAWAELPRSVLGKQFNPVRMTPDGKQLYSIGNLTGGPDQLAISNLDGTNRRVLASNPRVSIGSVKWTPAPRTPYAVIIPDGKPTVTYLENNKYATALKSLNEKFGDHFVNFYDMSEDGSTVILHASSDRDPGTFALYDMSNSSVRPLFQIEPWLKADLLAKRKPFWFKASSGTELEGFITLPPHRAEKNLPTIFIAHGGPIGPSDPWALGGSWENNESQFLATHGYAVVQVNYRGSGGRGKNFEESGKREMGTGMMQDMLDGLKWTIDQGYVDKSRVCIYGASYGGYTAYFQPVYAPQGTFKCSVAIAGVSDIRVQAHRSDTRRSRGGRYFLREAWGMDDPTYLEANSAIDHIDKFNVPVLIVHGEDDPRVPIQNAREFRDALKKADKPFEYMTRPKEGHGFFKEQNNVDRYEMTIAFLNKYLGPGAPVAD